MAVVPALRLAAQRLGMGLGPGPGSPPRRALWDGLRKKEKEEPEKIVAEEKKEPPRLVCPPPPSRSYLPPADLQSRLQSHVREVFGASLPEQWQQAPLDDLKRKYHLLSQLAAELGHAVPNSQLHLMRTAGDVLDFYSTPVKDASKLDELCAAKLPHNLKIMRKQ
ncbi:39S ribosomal protein L50, mitochondrial [Calypte anna]|uniref:39S ribosomal protein L50, mitochondrial n=1 Tax=Calypte anna TaxID=9244 RepID=UPI0011C395B6|nr:39S ribosomal protein L50, mitochondrial [Calypte anna]